MYKKIKYILENDNYMILQNTKFMGFSAGNLTSDAGILLIHKFFTKIKLSEKISNLELKDERITFEHSNCKIISNLIYLKMTGYKKPQYLKWLKNDPLWNSDNNIVSPSSVTRLYPRLTQSTNHNYKQINYTYAFDYINKHQSTVILDADSTGTDCYGKQQAANFIVHYRKKGYHAHLITDFKSGLILNEYLRDGHTYTSNGIIPMLQETIMKINNKKIKFRADSGYHDVKLFSFLEDNQIDYAIRMKGYPTFIKSVKEDIQLLNLDPNIYTTSNPYYCTVEQLRSDNRKFDIHYKVYFTTDAMGQTNLLPNVLMIASNIGDSAEKVFDFYNERGASENNNKELKNDFGANTLSHKNFLANEFDFSTSCLAYNLYRIFEITLIPYKRRIQGNTFIFQLVKIAGKVTKHAHKVSISLASCCPFKELFLVILNKLE